MPIEQVKGAQARLVLDYETSFGSDEADPADGYRKLSILEDKLTAAIYNWGVAVGKSFTGGSIMNIVIGETRGDQDSMRPNLGSQKGIKISWSKNN